MTCLLQDISTTSSEPNSNGETLAANCSNVSDQSMLSVENLKNILSQLFSYESVVNEQDKFITSLINYWACANVIEIPMSELLQHESLLYVSENVVYEAVSRGVETLKINKNRLSVKVELRPPRTTITLRDIDHSIKFKDIVSLLRKCQFLHYNPKNKMGLSELCSARRYCAWQNCCFWFLTFDTEAVTFNVALWLQSQTLNNSLLKVRIKTETCLTANELIFHRQQRKLALLAKARQKEKEMRRMEKEETLNCPSTQYLRTKLVRRGKTNGFSNNGRAIKSTRSSQQVPQSPPQVPGLKEFPLLYDTIDNHVSKNNKTKDDTMGKIANITLKGKARNCVKRFKSKEKRLDERNISLCSNKEYNLQLQLTDVQSILKCNDLVTQEGIDEIPELTTNVSCVSSSCKIPVRSR